MSVLVIPHGMPELTHGIYGDDYDEQAEKAAGDPAEHLGEGPQHSLTPCDWHDAGPDCIRLVRELAQALAS